MKVQIEDCASTGIMCASCHTASYYCYAVCSVIDAAELCRNVHSNPAYRSAAEDAFSDLSAYINSLNGNMSIFRHLKAIVTAAEGGSLSLTAEENILARDMLHELETEG